MDGYIDRQTDAANFVLQAQDFSIVELGLLEACLLLSTEDKLSQP